ncbi:AEC family transporter [Planctomycetota bacterium]
MLLRILPLFAVIALGAVAGAVRLFPSPVTAIGALNRFALYVAFPALVVAGLAADSLVLPQSAGFYLVHVVALLAQVVCAVALVAKVPALRRERGPVAMAAMFGNVAYLGIPFCVAVLGTAATGLAAMSAGIHILLSMTVGPVLLLAGGGGNVWGNLRAVLPRIVVQPLVWSPFLGLSLWLLGDGSRRFVTSLLSPVGNAAGPVALFMIGLYLYVNRGQFLEAGGAVLGICVLKLACFPSLTWLVVLLVGWAVPLAELECQLVVLMAGMPVAVTTFALAEEFRTGRKVISTAVVATTTMALLTLPLLASWIAS